MKNLFPQGVNFYKANLHSHTDVSDGVWTPEQMKEEYKKRGYSIFAYTDHNMMIDHSELSDVSFLALRGFEVQIAQSVPKGKTPKTCHICTIALDPDNYTMPCWNDKNVLHWKNLGKPAVDKVVYDKSKPQFEYAYTPEKISEYMKECREAGFFVTYNHPAWSMESAEQYLNYHGMNAMEICNFGCYSEGYEDYVPYIYDEILRGGERIYCIGSDDNHNIGDKPTHDSFGSFTVIMAEKLDYKTVTDAMVRGDMYASQGPEIHSLYVEDGKVYITSSPAKRIYVGTGMRYSRCIWAKDEPITEACFDIPESCGYIRLTVEDMQGRHANTRAYFEDELN